VLQVVERYSKLQEVGLKFTIFASQGDATRPYVAVSKDTACNTRAFTKG
jgi:hypothetical protein